MSVVNDWNRSIIEEFRRNSGKVGGRFEGRRLLLLHTTGARTRQPRINPLAYITDGDRLVIAASKAGAPSHPDWYYNLVAHPQVTVEVGTEQFQALAVVTVEPERSHLYEMIVREHPGFADYQQKTTRTIPVIVLTRIR